ncbi:MAG: C1 family peptidase [Deltaproteobacteria bacterium]|nr:C1 family peptidase [Deltaproteobacteria bacterium]
MAFGIRRGGTLLVAVLVAGCSSGTDPAPGEPLDAGALIGADAATVEPGRDAGPWATPPRQAQTVSSEELASLAATGDLHVVLPGDSAAHQAAREQRETADRAVVEELLAKRPELRARLERPFGSSAKVLPDGNLEVQIPDGKGGTKSITTMGQAHRLSTIANTYRRFNTVENQALIYEALHPRLPEGCAEGLPDPATVGTLALEELKALNRGAAKCWRNAIPSFAASTVTPPADLPTDPGQYEGASEQSAAGDYSDSSGESCAHDSNSLWFLHGWPTKYYDSNIKEQGRRGSCVAFGLVAAMETSIARLQGHRVNLAEQSLYARAKLVWAPDSLDDGLFGDEIAEEIRDDKWAVPFEKVWPYNPSPWREGRDDENHQTDDDPPDHYRFSCIDLNQDPYTGPACGETTHQAKLVFENGNMHYWTPKPAQANDGYTIAQVVELDDLEDTESANLAMAFMSWGYGVMVGFDVFQSFKDVGEAGTWNPANFDDEDLGGHAVQASGVLYNHHLPASKQGPGGGWVVIKNSWGCWGDAGYGYMAFEPASEVMYSAIALLPQRRGTNSAPTITITSPTESPIHLGLSSSGADLMIRAEVADAEDQLEATSIHWKVTPGGQTAVGDRYFFHSDTAGVYVVSGRITDSEGKSTNAAVTVAVEAPPVPYIDSPAANATLYRTSEILVEGHATTLTDLAGVACEGLVWKSSVTQDDLHQKTGCAVSTAFATNGPRTITLVATDALGGTASTSIQVTVVDPPASGPPVVTRVIPTGTEGSPYYVANPSTRLTLNASVTVPGRVRDCPADAPAPTCVSYVWRARVVGNPTYTQIGTAHTFSWIPGPVFPFSCGGYPIEVEVCASTSAGTGCGTTFLHLAYPVC